MEDKGHKHSSKYIQTGSSTNRFPKKTSSHFFRASSIGEIYKFDKPGSNNPSQNEALQQAMIHQPSQSNESAVQLN